MTSKKQIQFDDLEIGQLLPGDILDAEDKVLFREGLRLTPQIIEAWKRRGDGPYYLIAETTTPASAASGETLSTSGDYDPVQQAKIVEWFAEAARELDEMVDKLLADQTPSMRNIETQLDELFELIDRDAACIVHHIVTDDRNFQDQPSMARRSTYLAALSGVVANEHGLSREDCLKVSQAGMLHDLSLFPSLLSKLQDAFETDDDKQSVVARHAFMTTDLLSARVGVSDVVRVVINQVHEQMDGTGYPRGMPGHLINMMARVINLTDAFLTLIGAAGDHQGFVAGDAIAYLIHQTSRGTFDRDCMRAFLGAATLYGIGSHVQLEDGSAARVLRSVPGCPLQPIVLLEGEQPNIVDLSATNTQIVGPVVQPEFERRGRMPKSQMTEMLWKQEPLSEPTALAAGAS